MHKISGLLTRGSAPMGHGKRKNMGQVPEQEATGGMMEIGETKAVLPELPKVFNETFRFGEWTYFLHHPFLLEEIPDALDPTRALNLVDGMEMRNRELESMNLLVTMAQQREARAFSIVEMRAWLERKMLLPVEMRTVEMQGLEQQ